MKKAKNKFKCTLRYGVGDTKYVHLMLIQQAKAIFGVVNEKTLELAADRIMESCKIQGARYAVR